MLDTVTSASLAASGAPRVASPFANDLLIRACRREATERPPVWLMRQAGRYMPEYRAVRRRADFMTMVHTPELATEVTLQPVDILGVDAAIIFSDILVVPAAMGPVLRVDEGIGPHFDEPVRTAADVARLRDPDVDEDLGYVMAAIRMTVAALGGRVPLIGFAGGPWTLAGYVVEGSGTKSWATIKRMMMAEPLLLHRLLGRMADAVGRFLVAQARAGASVVQLFESWAGALGPDDFRRFALPYLARAAALPLAAGVPVIVFAPDAPVSHDEIARATGATVVGVHWKDAGAEARRMAERCGVGIQGNLDPCALYAPTDDVARRTREMLSRMDGAGYVANLGHGLLPDIPVDGVKAFVDTVQAWRSTWSERPASRATPVPMAAGARWQ